MRFSPFVFIIPYGHTNATLLIASGTDLRTVSKRLGHAQLSTTGNIYTHIDITRKQELAKNMSNTFTLEKPQENRCSEKC